MERWRSPVDRAALEMRYGATHRGFESHPLRRIHGDQLVSRYFFREKSINSLQTGQIHPNSIIGSPEYPRGVPVYLEGR